VNKYVLSYYGEPNFESPEAGMAYQESWMTWMQGLGDALVNPGVPTMKGKVVTRNGISDDETDPRLTGFSIIETESMDGALEMAKACPHLDHGTLHVAEAMDMEMNPDSPHV